MLLDITDKNRVFVRLDDKVTPKLFIFSCFQIFKKAKKNRSFFLFLPLLILHGIWQEKVKIKYWESYANRCAFAIRLMALGLKHCGNIVIN